MARVSFRVFCEVGAYRPGALAVPGVTAGRHRFAGNFFEYAEHVAEPDRCTEPPFALGTSALEFSNFDKSGLGGR